MDNSFDNATTCAYHIHDINIIMPYCCLVSVCIIKIFFCVQKAKYCDKDMVHQTPHRSSLNMLKPLRIWGSIIMLIENHIIMH